LPALERDEIDVWIVDLAARDAGDITSARILAPAERERASRFKYEVDRSCFIQRRAALRMILSEYLGVAPQSIAFTENEFGKPSVVTPQAAAGLSFNASHSGTLAVIAVARSGRIGVDVERLRPLVEAESIAARFLATGEAATLAALHPHERTEGFFNAWTRKEAVVKALGGGLSIPLDSFEVSLRPGEPPAILRWDIPEAAQTHWRIQDLDLPEDYVGALVTDSGATVCRYQRWAG